jgi:hypothetical protein
VLKAKGDLEGAFAEYRMGVCLRPDHAGENHDLGVGFRRKSDR